MANNDNDFRNMAGQRILQPARQKNKILRSIIPALVTLIAVIGLIYLGWNAYQESVGPVDPSKIPVAKADGKPYKVEAENKAEETNPDMDKKVYDAIAPAKNDADDTEGGGIHVVTQNEEPVERGNAKAPEQKPAEPQAATTTAEADDEGAPPPPSIPAEPVKIAEAKPAAPPAPAPAAAAEKKPVILTEAKKPKKEPLKKAAAPSAPSAKALAKSTKIQLGAYKSTAEAKQQWERIHKKYAKSLGDLHMVIEKADIKNKGVFYRLQAGPLKSFDAARVLCKKLTESKQGCFIIEPK